MKSKFTNLFSLLLFCSCSLLAQEKKAGKIVSEYFALLDAGKIEAVGQMLTDNFQAIAPFSPTPFDKKNWLGVGQGFKAAFPDMKHEISFWFADDNWVAVRGNFIGINSGPFMGQAPTNNKVIAAFTTLFELDGKGKIKLAIPSFDQKSMEMQLMAGAADPKMKAEKSIRELYALMDDGKVEQFPKYCASDFKTTNPFVDAPSPIQVFQGIIKSQKAAFPDMKHEITELITDGKYVTTKGIFKGTNTGSMMGNPPTGNKVNFPFLVLDELNSEGKLKNRFVQFDRKVFEMQLMAGINPNANKEKLIRDMLQAADAADVQKFASFWDPQGKSYFGNQENTMKETQDRLLAFKTGMPDVHRQIEEIFVSGNQLTIRGVLTGTNTGKFMGKPATNNPIKLGWLGVYIFNDANKIVTGRVEFDSAAFEAQLSKPKMKSKK